MALAFTYRGRLIIVLDEENVERIQQNDPFDFDGRKAPEPIALAIPLQISIVYARKDEMPRIAAMQHTPDLLMEYLGRGFTVTPSDHQRGDHSYELLPPEKRGTRLP